MTKNTPVKKDWFVLGLATGIGSTIVKTLIEWSLPKSSIPSIDFSSVAGGLILGKRNQGHGVIPSKKSFSRGERLIGNLTNIVYGGIFGLTTSYVLAKTPPGSETLKGAFSGATWWAVNLTIGNQLDLDGLSRVTPAQMGTSFVSHTVFGALQGLIHAKYGAKLITQSHPTLVKSVSSQDFDKGRMEMKTNNGYQPQYQQ